MDFSFRLSSASAQLSGQIARRFDQHRVPFLVASLGAIAAGIAVSLRPTLPTIVLVALAALAFLFLASPHAAVLALLAIRPAIDVLQDRSLLSVEGQVEVNVAGALGIEIVVLGACYIIAKRMNPFNNPISIAYATFVALGLIGYWFSSHPMVVLADWLRAVSLLTIFILVYHLYSTKAGVSQVLWAIGLSSTLPLLLGTIQFVTGTGVDVDGFNRAYGTFVVPPVYASYLVMVLPLVVALLFNSRTWWARVGLGAWLLFVAVNLYATYTRGAWIGAGLALLILGIFRFRTLLRLLPLTMVLALVAVPQAVDRFSDLGKEQLQASDNAPNTLVGRLRLWEGEVLKVERSNVFVGAGLGTVRKIVGNDAHNDYLRLFVETGLLGLVSYLVLLYVMAREAWISWRRQRERRYKDVALAFLGIFAAYALMSTTDNIVLKPVLQWYFWSLAAVTVGLERKALLQRETVDGET